MRELFTVLLVFAVAALSAQEVYKVPSPDKFNTSIHTAVSSSLTNSGSKDLLNASRYIPKNIVNCVGIDKIRGIQGIENDTYILPIVRKIDSTAYSFELLWCSNLDLSSISISEEYAGFVEELACEKHISICIDKELYKDSEFEIMYLNALFTLRRMQLDGKNVADWLKYGVGYYQPAGIYLNAAQVSMSEVSNRALSEKYDHFFIRKIKDSKELLPGEDKYVAQFVPAIDGDKKAYRLNVYSPKTGLIHSELYLDKDNGLLSRADLLVINKRYEERDEAKEKLLRSKK